VLRAVGYRRKEVLRAVGYRRKEVLRAVGYKSKEVLRAVGYKSKEVLRAVGYKSKCIRIWGKKQNSLMISMQAEGTIKTDYFVLYKLMLCEYPVAFLALM
jgi:regulator of protease activity HflC (stomatin/prohibitin superfamily)